MDALTEILKAESGKEVRLEILTSKEDSNEVQ